MANTRRRSPADAAPARDHYEDVTDRIVAALEQGVLPWRRPWDPARAGMDHRPRNPTTGRVYRGINILMLAMTSFAYGSGDHRWCSYRQAAERGWQVRKGERGTTVFFFRRFEVEGRPTLDGETAPGRWGAMLRASTVFHASQIDGMPPEPAPETVPAANWERPPAVETMLRNSRAVIRTGGPRAFYSPISDHIQLPPCEAFDDAYGWASVACHELCHWSGAEHRLKRDLSGQHGSSKYQHEELIAELGSCMIADVLGLPCDIPNHASYLDSWLRHLRSDKREIFRAAAAAQRAADYCLAFHPDHASDGDEPEADAAMQPMAA